MDKKFMEYYQYGKEDALKYADDLHKKGHVCVKIGDDFPIEIM